MNKTDTPRTGSFEEVYEIQTARIEELERDLSAAQERIKELEGALDGAERRAAHWAKSADAWTERMYGRYEKYAATVRAIGCPGLLSFDQWLTETDQENL